MDSLANKYRAGKLGKAKIFMLYWDTNKLEKLKGPSSNTHLTADHKLRVNQFTQYPVVCTKASRFIAKARLFPKCVFCLGADTAVRLVDVKYYEQSTEKMVAALTEMIDTLGCEFLVAGRLDAKGVFVTCKQEVDAALPPSLSRAFQFLREDEFRVDLSSTQLRAALE
jgi:hypothetical protein